MMVTVTIDSGTSESMATRLPDMAPRATDDSDDSDPRQGPTDFGDPRQWQGRPR